MKVPFLDLSSQTRTVLDDFFQAARTLAQTNEFVGGDAVAAFEREFAAYCGVRHCVALNSGTDGLRLSLLAAGVGPRDEVITSPFTFIATAEAISQTGSLALADVSPETFTLSPQAVENRITRHTRAVLPVHIFGLPARLPDFQLLAKRHGLTLIEDACQAHGAAIEQRRVGGFGHASGFSFYPTKNLGAFGDAGAVTTDDEGVADRVRRLRNHGEEEKYQHREEGYNSRMDTLQAAVLRLKLPFLEGWIAQRRRLAALYRSRLDDVEEVRFQEEPDGFRHVYHLLAVLVERRSELKDYLRRRGIETRIVYPTPIHLLPAYRHLKHARGDFPEAERVSEQVLCLPLFPGMAETQALQVVGAVKDFYAG